VCAQIRLGQLNRVLSELRKLKSLLDSLHKGLDRDKGAPPDKDLVMRILQARFEWLGFVCRTKTCLPCCCISEGPVHFWLR
jgi:hypothetical protein